MENNQTKSSANNSNSTSKGFEPEDKFILLMIIGGVGTLYCLYTMYCDMSYWRYKYRAPWSSHEVFILLLLAVSIGVYLYAKFSRLALLKRKMNSVKTEDNKQKEQKEKEQEPIQTKIEKVKSEIIADNRIIQLKKYKKLADSNTITEQEFASMKAPLLNYDAETDISDFECIQLLLEYKKLFQDKTITDKEFQTIRTQLLQLKKKAKTREALSMDESIELLSQFKELLDANVLTAEEYNQIKSQFLNL